MAEKVRATVQGAVKSFFNETLARRVGALLLVCAGLFLLLSLVTFDRNDLSEFSQPPNYPVRNACGVVGAHVAGLLLKLVGVSSLIVVMLMVAWGISSLTGLAQQPRIQRATGSLLLVLSICAISDMLPWQPEFPVTLGGHVGLAVGGVLTRYFGVWGGWMFALIFLVLSCMLLSIDQTVYRAGVRLWGLAIKESARRRQAGEQARRCSPVRTFPSVPTPAAATSLGQRPQPKPEPAESRPESTPALRPDWVAKPTAPSGSQPSTGVGKASLKKPAAAPGPDNYKLPPLDLLERTEPLEMAKQEDAVREKVDILEQTLSDFGIKAKVVNIESGPVVTRYELSLAAGVKVQRVVGLSDDIAIATKAPSVRIVAPIPGKSTVGVEIPNALKQIVRLREQVESEEYQSREFEIPIFLGRDTSGRPLIEDLTRMPHLLIAGATGSGKSVCLNAMLMSMLMTCSPHDLRLILVDPKMVELSTYEGLPHLYTPVVTDMRRAPRILEWAVQKMDERYDLLARVGARHIRQYNLLGEAGIRKRLGPDYDPEQTPAHLPYVVIIVDEFADMMLIARKEVEYSITRLAQKSRAVGIHIVLATQRPSVDVITGLIKSNMPTRISFQTTAKVDSRIILDRNGAEDLLGCGDMLYLPPGTSDLVRGQGTFISDQEIHNVLNWIKHQHNGAFAPVSIEQIEGGASPDTASEFGDYSEDELYEDAVRIVLENRRGSVSLLQRKLEIGYTRAARLIEIMEMNGVVGPYKGSKTRELLITLEEWEAQQARKSGRAPAVNPTPGVSASFPQVQAPAPGTLPPNAKDNDDNFPREDPTR